MAASKLCQRQYLLARLGASIRPSLRSLWSQAAPLHLNYSSLYKQHLPHQQPLPLAMLLARTWPICCLWLAYLCGFQTSPCVHIRPLKIVLLCLAPPSSHLSAYLFSALSHGLLAFHFWQGRLFIFIISQRLRQICCQKMTYHHRYQPPVL